MDTRRACIYRLDNSEEVNREATDLSKLLTEQELGNKPALLIGDFRRDAQNPLNHFEIWGDAPGVPQDIFCLGHSPAEKNYRRYVSGFTAEEFAKRFAELFQKNKNKRLNLYLISCSGGLSDPEANDSYAQHVADYLAGLGFKDLTVYAPQHQRTLDDQVERMVVQVRSSVTKLEARIDGNAQQVRALVPEYAETVPPYQNKRPGLISVYRTTPQTQREAADLETAARQLETATREITNSTPSEGKTVAASKHKKAELKLTPIVEDVHPMDLFRLPQNVFRAGETYRQRQKRIAGETDAILRVELLARLRKIVVTESGIGKPFGPDALGRTNSKNNILLNKVLKDIEEDKSRPCMEIYRAFAVAFDQANFGLVGLYHDGRVKIAELKDFQLIKDGKLQLASATEAFAVNAKPALQGVRESKSDLSPHRVTGTLWNPSSPRASESKEDTAIPKNLRDEMENLQHILSREITQLEDRAKQSLLGFIYSGELRSKRSKRDCVNSLLAARTMQELKTTATDYLKLGWDNIWVNWKLRNTSTGKWATSRTSNLLNQIADHKASVDARFSGPRLTVRVNLD